MKITGAKDCYLIASLQKNSHKDAKTLRITKDYLLRSLCYFVPLRLGGNSYFFLTTNLTVLLVLCSSRISRPSVILFTDSGV